MGYSGPAARLERGTERSAKLKARVAVLALVLVAAGGVFAGPGSALAADLVGGLYVVTDPPEAAVYVNGELKGVSPCRIPDVAVGEAEIEWTFLCPGWPTSGALPCWSIRRDRTSSSIVFLGGARRPCC